MHTDYIVAASFSQTQGWLLVSLVTLLALLLYLSLIVLVGAARGKYKVPPPAMTGPAEFERRMRVQQNMTEQLLLFLPSLWLFGIMLERPGLGSAIGAVWLAGRVLYSVGYSADAQKRLPGFVIGQVCTLALMLGALWGVTVKLLF